MRRSRHRHAGGLLVVLIALAGCGSAGEAPITVASADPIPAWTAFWSRHGVTEPPPRDIFDLHRAVNPGMNNMTAGLVSDQDQARWTLAALRTYSARTWALEHLRHDIINADVLGPAGLSGTETYLFDIEKRGANGLTISDPPSTDTALAPLSDAQAMEMVPGHPGSYAILIRQKGAFDGTVLYSDGHTESLFHQAADARSVQIYIGELHEDPAAGDLWYVWATASCSGRRGPATVALCARLGA